MGMTFDLNGVEYRMYFTYDKHDGRREIGCVIKSSTDDNYASGSASCSLSDRFVKETGRVMALERALKFAIKKKGQRDDFWRAAMCSYSNRAQIKRKEVSA